MEIMREYWRPAEEHFVQVNNEFKNTEATNVFRVQNIQDEFRDFQHDDCFTHLIAEHVKLATTGIERAA